MKLNLFIISKSQYVEFVEKFDKKIIVSGLDGDSNRDKFGEILDLIPVCDKIDKLYPFCLTCWEENNIVTNALFSKRMIKSSEKINVGGKESYRPVCRQCFPK